MSPAFGSVMRQTADAIGIARQGQQLFIAGFQGHNRQVIGLSPLMRRLSGFLRCAVPQERPAAVSPAAVSALFLQQSDRTVVAVAHLHPRPLPSVPAAAGGKAAPACVRQPTRFPPRQRPFPLQLPRVRLLPVCSIHSVPAGAAVAAPSTTEVRAQSGSSARACGGTNSVARGHPFTTNVSNIAGLA